MVSVTAVASLGSMTSREPTTSRYFNGVTRVLQCCYKSITVVLQWCYISVTMVIQWRHKSVTVVF
jgi:hypothetical protein